MKRMVATDAKTNFGHLIDTALSEPVAIERNGREVTVMISRAEYERLKRLEAEAQERAALADFAAGRAAKSETMQALGIMTPHELRMKMTQYGIAPPHLPRGRVEEMISSIEPLLFGRRARLKR